MQVIQKIKAKLNNPPRRVILDTRKKCSNNSTWRIINNMARILPCLNGQHKNPTRGRVQPARRPKVARWASPQICEQARLFSAPTAICHRRGALTLALPRCGMPRVGIFYVATMLVPALALGIACLSYSASAEIGSSDVDFSLSVDATPSLEIVLAGDGLTTSPTSLGLNIKPNIDGTPVFGYSDLDVTVATSNATGYYLNFSTTNADGSLRTTNSSTLSTLADTGTFTCTTATASTCSFTTNRWGYKLAQDDATSYIAAPGSDGTKIDEIYTKTNGVTSNLRVGAKVDSSLTAGNYSTTMSFAATAHPTTYGIYYNYGAAEGTSPAPSGLPGNQSGALNNSATTTVTLSSDTPTWTGHTFNKWCLGTVTSTEYADDTCTGTEYSPGDTITFSMDDVVSVTLKAMWNINSYSIKYGTVTGISSVTLDGQACTAAVSGTGCSKTLIYGKPYNISATASTGYSFSSFSATAGSFNAEYTTYTPAAGTATITPNASANTYSITIKTATGISSVSLSGGNLTSACSTTSTSGTNCTLTYGQTYTLAAVASTGYTFSSWSNSASQGTIGGTTTASTTYTPGTAATTLTPSATPISYTVTISNTNTTSGASSISVPYNGSNTVTVTPSSGYYLSGVSCPSGYTCSGYNTGTSYTSQQTITVTNNGTTSGGTLSFTGTVSGYSYNLTFNGNGGTPSSTSLSGTGTTITLPTATYHTASTTNTSTRYATLAGWSETPNASSATYTDSMTISSATTKTLYAVWNFNSGTLQNTSSTCGDNMIDARTGVSYLTYTINGACYMEQNLYLPVNFTLYAGDSNIYNTHADKNQKLSWTTPSSSTIPSNSYDTPYMVTGTYTDNTYNATGGWYNYCAASAQTVCGSSTQEDAYSDICPKGWKLFTSAQRSGIVSASRSNWMFYAGGYLGGSLQNDSTFSYWWSATGSNATSQYYLYYSGGSLRTSNYNKYRGLFVRCVRR